MATTSLWKIKGRLKDLMEYVENPAKTQKAELQDFFNAMEYARNPEKTEQGYYVTAINCLKEIALQQMILTKEQFGKKDGIIAWHGYQSFKPGEVTAEECHAIGIETAKAMWGENYQIIVTTHLDKDHLHNHFLLNSVSFRTGQKYNYTNAERRRMVAVSDQLCREHGLSIIEKLKKAPGRTVWEDEKAGKPTRYNVYRADFINAMNGSRTLALVQRYLEELGYDVDFTGEKWKIKLNCYRYFTHLETLDPQWTPEYVKSHLGRDTLYGNIPAVVTQSPYVPEELQGVWQRGQRTENIYHLFLWWQYQLGAKPEWKHYEPTSPYMREELRQLDSLFEQVKYLCNNKIETREQLWDHLRETEKALGEELQNRDKLRNKLRRAKPEEKEEYCRLRDQATKHIQALRKTKKIILAIEERSARIDNTMEQIMDNADRAKEQARLRRQLKERKYYR